MICDFIASSALFGEQWREKFVSVHVQHRLKCFQSAVFGSTEAEPTEAEG